MAAIIAQLTLANRRRKKNAKGYLPCDKSNYILKPFDPVFEPKKHVLYLLKRDHYEYKHEIKTKAKGKIVLLTCCIWKRKIILKLLYLRVC